MSGPWTLVVPASLWNRLSTHLFPGDCDEHGAVLAAGVASSACGARLLVRDVFEAKDAVDYVSSPRAYRMLKTEFIRERILYCRDEKLAYLAVHCHGGTDAVDFSAEDLASHERGYPALRDIARGQIIGGLVFARNAVAGDLWLPDGSRARLTDARIVGANLTRLYPTPPTPLARTDPTYDRQTRLFGDAGQDIVRRLKVGVIGAGGVGSLLVEYLARLGVGHLVVTDHALKTSRACMVSAAKNRESQSVKRRATVSFTMSPTIGSILMLGLATRATRAAIFTLYEEKRSPRRLIHPGRRSESVRQRRYREHRGGVQHRPTSVAWSGVLVVQWADFSCSVAGRGPV